MANQSRLSVVPMFPEESLYVGVDVGKHKHVAGFLSKGLLQRHERFEACPALTFENSRDGFRILVDRLRTYSPLEQVYILLEHTGHYHRALEQYLQEHDLALYIIHVQRRTTGLLKTDKRDALGLANTLYSQLELGVQVADKLQLIHRAFPPTEAASLVQGLIRHRYELMHESTQRRNKLTSICDEIFPEFATLFKDPNREVALAIREKYPTPHAIATASLTALREVRIGHHPSEEKLLDLQRLASQSIGVKSTNRLRGLIFEQGQLIKELRLIQEHVQFLDAEICDTVEQSREGRILTSIPGIGPIAAATLIATIGTIANFDSAARLKSYLGWAPTRVQSGTSLDRVHLTHQGARQTKNMLYLIVWGALHNKECEWAKMYERLVPIKCAYNEQTRTYVGKGKVIGRIAGQIIAMIYALLMTDYEATSHLAPGAKLPEPMLYDAEIHKQHRAGNYRPRKPRLRQQLIIRSAST